MKRISLLFAIIMMATSALYAAGVQEAPTSITVLTGTALPDLVLSEFAVEYPGVEVEQLIVPANDMKTKMTALVAAGEAPDVYIDYMGRVAQYVDPAYALPLDHPDFADYVPGALEPLTRDGNVLALHLQGAAQGLAVNMDLLETIGQADFNFDGWSIMDFVDLMSHAKEQGKYGTGLFAGNQSGDYLYMNWFAAFGAEMYRAGDYTKTVINSPAGIKTLTFLKFMIDKGYAPANASVLVDDDYVLQWANGELLFAPFFASWIEPYFKTIEEQGGKRFEYKFVEYPHAKGVRAVPVFMSYAGAVASNSPDEARNKIINYFMWALNSPAVVTWRCETQGAVSNRKSVAYSGDADYNAISAIVADNGLLDLGLAMPKYGEVRMEMFPRLQALYTGKESPAEALAKYEARVNEILSE